MDRWARMKSFSGCGSPGRLDFTLQPIFFRSAVSQAPDCYSEKFGWSHLPWLTECQNQGHQGLGRFRVSTCLGLSMSEGVSGCGAVHAKRQIGCPHTSASVAFICEMRFHAPVNAQGTLHPRPQRCLDCSFVDWSVSPDSSRVHWMLPIKPWAFSVFFLKFIKNRPRKWEWMPQYIFWDVQSINRTTFRDLEF